MPSETDKGFAPVPQVSLSMLDLLQLLDQDIFRGAGHREGLDEARHWMDTRLAKFEGLPCSLRVASTSPLLYPPLINLIVERWRPSAMTVLIPGGQGGLMHPHKDRRR